MQALLFTWGIIYNIIYWRNYHGRPWQSGNFTGSYFIDCFDIIETPFSRRLRNVNGIDRICSRVEQKAEEGDKNTFVFLAYWSNQTICILFRWGSLWLPSYLGRVLRIALDMSLLDGWAIPKQLMQLEAFYLAFLTYISIVFGELSKRIAMNLKDELAVPNSSDCDSIEGVVLFGCFQRRPTFWAVSRQWNSDDRMKRWRGMKSIICCPIIETLDRTRFRD